MIHGSSQLGVSMKSKKSGNTRLVLTALLSLTFSISSLVAYAANPQSKSAKTAGIAGGANAHHGLVHWESWTDDLFARARQEKKLVLLDLEAVWCHWCHVMDQKTYSDPELAAFLKEHFICVKVDQDSRPDLSNRYEDYGWPATIIFASNGEELAKHSGYIELDEMLELVKALVKNPVPEENYKAKELNFAAEAALSKALRQELFNNHRKLYDDKEGGWQTVHKFLDADSVELALTLAKLKDKRAEQMARQTLDKQLNLIDPVWGGVYQYSTGGNWKHPHFEKIMSVQGENARIYALAYLYFKDQKYLNAAEKIAAYLKNFLTSPEGAFYTSQDADLKQGEHSGDFFKLDDKARRKLGIPKIDKHVYARENGWAICGLANLYMASGNKTYLDQAEKAAQWILKNRALAGGGFRHDAKDASGPYLGDTLFMGRAFLSLYQATGSRRYLGFAEEAAGFIDSNFKNGEKKAGYLTASSKGASFAGGPRPLLDENAVLCRFANLLSYYSGKEKYKDMAKSCMRYLATDEIAHDRKIMVAGILLCDREIASGPAHITVVGAKGDPAAASLFAAANKYPLSYKRVEWLDAKEGKLPNPDTEYPEMPKAAAFACANNRCSAPAYTAVEIADRVDKTMKLK